MMRKTTRTWIIVGIIFFGLLGIAGFNAAYRFTERSTAKGNMILGWICTSISVLLIIIFVWRSIKVKKRILQNFEGSADLSNNKTPPSYDALPNLENLSARDLVSISFQKIDSDENVPPAKGSELSYLDAQALRFWNKKHTDFKIPPYYSETAFGRNVGPALKRLLDGKYLSTGDIKKRISLKTVPELKAILAEKELKVSGNKSELVCRLIDNVPPYELEELFPVNVYILTEKGQQALKPYSILENNDNHALGFSYYRLIQAKNQTPNDEDDDILARLLSEDLQTAYQNGNRTSAQMTLTKMGRFFEEIGKVQLALDAYILMFFIWALEIKDGQVPYSNGQNYYMALNLDRCGKLCDYTLDHLIDLMRKNIYQSHLFGIGTTENIDFTIKLFKDSLKIK